MVVYVFAGGDAPGSVEVPAGATVIAADGGAAHALALGVRIDLAVGDFDSFDPAALPAGTRVERHRRDKDKTDLELALDAAVALGATRVVVVGGGGGRLDHLLGGLLLLAADAYAGIELDALVGAAAVHVVRGERTLAGTPGETLSLFALGGPASGVTTDGLRYALRGETLEPGTTRGVSNELAAPEARIAVAEGVLLAVRPDPGS
jgi:thiamine pyrophosphokinase